MTLSESFMELLVAGDQKASLASLLCSSACSGTERGPQWLGSYSVVWCIRHFKVHPGWGPML